MGQNNSTLEVLMNVLVTGAFGSVGQHLVKQLIKKNISVRALSHTPQTLDNLHGAEIITGDLSNADTLINALSGIDCIFLLLTPYSDSRIIQYAQNAGVKKIVALSDGTMYPIEEALYASQLQWTMLRPVEFMKNSLTFWKDSIKNEGIARAPFPNSPSVKIHEDDIAEVAALTIIEDTHNKKEYYLTGPQVLTSLSMVKELSIVLEKPIQFIELTEEEARIEYKSLGFDDALIDFAIESGKNPQEYYYTILPTVEELLGRPAKTFAEWVIDNKEEFI